MCVVVGVAGAGAALGHRPAEDEVGQGQQREGTVGGGERTLAQPTQRSE